MAYPSNRRRPAILSSLLAGFAAVIAASGWAAPPAPQMQPVGTPHLDRSGRARVGKASFYAHRFAGRKMADGTPMRLEGNNAASKTLPLGTTAMVTNLQTGRTAIVTIRDRGPYVKGRIVDLSPSTAHKIGLEPKQGVTKVEVAPLEVPLPGGAMKAGGPYPDPKKILSARAARAGESPPEAGG